MTPLIISIFVFCATFGTFILVRILITLERIEEKLEGEWPDPPKEPRP